MWGCEVIFQKRAFPCIFVPRLSFWAGEGGRRGGIERDSDLFIKLWAASTTGGQRQSSTTSKCSKRESCGFCSRVVFHVVYCACFSSQIFKEDVLLWKLKRKLKEIRAGDISIFQHSTHRLWCRVWRVSQKKIAKQKLGQKIISKIGSCWAKFSNGHNLGVLDST